MKKTILALLLSTVFVSPVFAEETSVPSSVTEKLGEDLTKLQTEIAQKVEWAPKKINEQIDQTNFLLGGDAIKLDKDGKPEGGHGLGSGTLIDKEKGIILTVAHVVVALQNMKAVVFDYQEDRTIETDYDVDAVMAEPQLDVALVRLKAKLPNTIEAKLACEDPQRGDTIYAVGNPRGQEGTLTKGMVTNRKQHVTMPNLSVKMIPFDAPIDHGSSGGALYNEYGEIVGINSMMQDPVKGFAVPVSTIKIWLQAKGIDYTKYLSARCKSETK